MQHLSLITLGIKDIKRSKKFYTKGFGWKPLLEQPDTILYQLSGMILGTWLIQEFAQDVSQAARSQNEAIALAQCVHTAEEVQPMLNKLANYGGKILRNASAPNHGGMRGYVEDPDSHIWEIIWNPLWHIAHDGSVSISS